VVTARYYATVLAQSSTLTKGTMHKHSEY